MNPVVWPEGFRLERLRREHSRKTFHSGVKEVDAWLATKALQHQEKKLSTTQVLLDDARVIAGYYTLAIGEIAFDALPAEIVKQLPRRQLPVAVLAWLGMDSTRQGQGLGSRLLAQALRDCYEAGKTFAFVAVILDALNDEAKTFYQRWQFAELPGHSYRLFLSAKQLEALMTIP